jgi:DNA repair protein RadA/Sms
LVVIDSIQTMHSDLIEGAARHGQPGARVGGGADPFRQGDRDGGGPRRPRHQGRLDAGPRVLEHMVDTVLSFEGERATNTRICAPRRTASAARRDRRLRDGGGGADAEVSNSFACSSRSGEAVSGAVVFPGPRRHTAVLVKSRRSTVRLASGATPRRAVVGWDSGR